MSISAQDLQHRLRRVAGLLDKQLFFIVGLSRAGTVWLQYAIDAHPEARCRSEGHFTDHLFPLLGKSFIAYNRTMAREKKLLDAAGIGASIPGRLPGFSNADVSFLMAISAATILAQSGGETEAIRCIGEKTPEHALGLDDLKRILPQAKIIHVIRDGRDEAVSVFDYNLRVSGERFSRKYPNFGDFCGEFAANWTRLVGAARYFGRHNKDSYIEVRSEDLHTEAGTDIARVCRFLGIDDEDDAVGECVAAGRRIAFPDGIIGQWRERFDADASRDFNRHAGELLKLLDYDL